MKKTLIFSAALFLLIMCVPSVYGWSNGKSGTAYADNSESYSYSDNYSTHDWIADRALSILYADSAKSWQWLMDRRSIFLVGTEAPDNSGVSMTLNGILVEGFGDTASHHIYFNEDGTIYNNEDDSALRAKSCGDLANSYIADEKYDLAAFYLGAMTHYIADMSMYAHTARNNVAPHYVDFDLYHSEVEGYVHSRTNAYSDLEEFFQFSSITIENQAPYDVATELAWNTYKDELGGYGARWMHDSFFSKWKSSYDDRFLDTSANQTYYNRIEESLNLAIKGCADAISYELDYEPNDIPFIFGWGWFFFFLAIAIIITKKKIS